MIGELIQDIELQEEYNINNDIYNTIIDGGIEVLKNPIAFGEDNPTKILDEQIEFFAALDTPAGYQKCSRLSILKKQLLGE